jgi:HTH-type transcriptional regulator/antitoxin HipB
MSKKKNIKTLDEFVEEQYGKRGTPKREKLEKGFEAFKLGVLIQQARLEKGLTQEQLAARCGTNKGYISKIENDIKEVRLSTLQKIVEIGLGGKLQLSIRL